MELRQLAYFVAVAEEGQLTRAAVRLSIAQPAISVQLRRLERELGERLFHRDHRGVRLTAAGDQLLPHARMALSAVDRCRDSVAALRGLLAGRLSVGVSGPMDDRLPVTLGTFHREHPDVEIVVVDQHNAPLLAAVSRGDLDMAIIGLDGRSMPANVERRVIASEPLVLGVPPGHELAGAHSARLDVLREQPLVTLTEGSGLRTVLENACRSRGFAPVVAVETNELATMVELATEGLGMAVLPRSATAGTGLAVVDLTRPRLRRRTAIVWNNLATTPAGRAFLALAETHLPNTTNAVPA